MATIKTILFNLLFFDRCCIMYHYIISCLCVNPLFFLLCLYQSHFILIHFTSSTLPHPSLDSTSRSQVPSVPSSTPLEFSIELKIDGDNTPLIYQFDLTVLPAKPVAWKIYADDHIAEGTHGLLPFTSRLCPSFAPSLLILFTLFFLLPSFL